MPSDDVPEPVTFTPSSNSSSAFWRRRSYSDALEKSWEALKHESFMSESSTHTQSSQATPIATEFGQHSRSSSIRLTSFDFLIPFFSRDGSKHTSIRSSMRPMSLENAHRRHSSPLILGAETILTDTLDRRLSASSQQSNPSVSQSSNRSSVMMSTVKECSKANQMQSEQSQQGLSTIVASGHSADFVETESLSIPPLSRSKYRSYLQGRGNGRHYNVDSGNDGDDNVHATGQADTGLTPRPHPHPRIGDMKKA